MSYTYLSVFVCSKLAVVWKLPFQRALCRLGCAAKKNGTLFLLLQSYFAHLRPLTTGSDWHSGGELSLAEAREIFV